MHMFHKGIMMPTKRLTVLIAVITCIIFGLSAVDLLQEPVFPPFSEVVVDLSE